MDLRFDDDAIPIPPHEQIRRTELRQHDYIIPSIFQPHVSRFDYVCELPNQTPTLEKCPSIPHFHTYPVVQAERIIPTSETTAAAKSLWNDVITEASIPSIPERLMRSTRMLSEQPQHQHDMECICLPPQRETVFSFMSHGNANRPSSPEFPHIDSTPSSIKHDCILSPPAMRPIPTPTIRLSRAPSTTTRVPLPRIDVDGDVTPKPVTRVDDFPVENMTLATKQPLLHVSIPTSVLEPKVSTSSSTSKSMATSLPPRSNRRPSPRLIPLHVPVPPSTPHLLSPTYATSNNGYRSPYVSVETERDVQGLQNYLTTSYRPEPLLNEIKTVEPAHALNECIEPWNHKISSMSSSTVYYKNKFPIEDEKKYVDDDNDNDDDTQHNNISLLDLARSSSSSNLFMLQASCAICLSSKCDCILLPCSHSFHASCILDWVDSTHGRRFSCPLCRQSIEQLIPISRNSPRHTSHHIRRASTGMHEPSHNISMRHHDDNDIPNKSRLESQTGILIDTIVPTTSSAYDELLHRFTQSWERYYYQGGETGSSTDDGNSEDILKKGTSLVLDDHEAEQAEQLISIHDTQQYEPQSQDSSESCPTPSQQQSPTLLYDDLLPDVFYIPTSFPEFSESDEPTSTTLYIPHPMARSHHITPRIHETQTYNEMPITSWQHPFSTSITTLIHAIRERTWEHTTPPPTTSTSPAPLTLAVTTSPLYAGAFAGLACSISSMLFGSSAARVASATTAARVSLQHVSSLGRTWATALQTMRTTIPSVAIYFLSYETMKRYLIPPHEHGHTSDYMIAATLAGTLSNIRNLRTHPTVPLRIGAQFALFEQIKNYMMMNQDGILQPSQVLAAAAAGGLVAYSFEYPIASAWTHYQNRRSPSPIPRPASVLSSLPQQLLRSLPTCAITAVSFEMAHRYMLNHNHNQIIPTQIPTRASTPPLSTSTSTSPTPAPIPSNQDTTPIPIWNYGDVTI